MSKFALFAQDTGALPVRARRIAPVSFAIAVTLWATLMAFVGYVVLFL